MFSRRTGWNLATNRYTQALEAHRRSGSELLDLTASNPTTVGLDYRKQELSQALIQDEIFSYEPAAKGMLSAREAVAAYYAEKQVSVDPEDFVLTTSTSEAYSFVFRLLCDPGDSVLVPTPSYPLFDFLADLNDVKLEPYELVYDHGWQIDFTSVAAALERSESVERHCRAILVVHPNNPTGSFTKLSEQRELSRICQNRDMAIIADEVFLDYSLAASAPPTFVANDACLTFTLSGISKISALPQMKVAWIAVSGPKELKKDAFARLEVIADTYLSMNAPIQLAVPAMLDERRHVQPQLLRRVRENLSALDKCLATHKLCTRLKVEGGWYAVLRVPALGSDEDLAISLLEHTNVLLQPGHFYNFSSDGYLVASLIAPPDIFRKGIERTLEYSSTR
jgi:aspartate/methionine/tyrosine aminotransferase